jgi:hypothetical protein
VLVTLLVVLTLECVALLLFAPALGPVLNQAAGILSLQLATDPDLRSAFEAEPPDPQQVGAVLRRFEPGDGVRVLVGADGTSQVRTSVNPPASGPSLGMSQSELLVALVDRSGRVVTGTQHLALAQGMPFGELEPGAAQTVVDAALGGNNSTARDRNGQHAAWPIQDARYQVRGAT